jgi:hypothetical protein
MLRIAHEKKQYFKSRIRAVLSLGERNSGTGGTFSDVHVIQQWRVASAKIVGTFARLNVGTSGERRKAIRDNLYARLPQEARLGSG